MPNSNTPTPHEREQLERWLHAYALDRQLREAQTPPIRSKGTKNPSPAKVACGQIRLVPPFSPTQPETERPIFLLVFACHQDETATVMPFARFDIPATPGEWSTEFEYPAIKTLCFWNQRNVTTESLSRTWCASALDGKAMQQIEAGFAMFTSVSERASPRHGPPLLHPLDPRQIYLQEEKTLLDDAARDILATSNCGKTLLYPVETSSIEQKLAAEDGSDYEGNPTPR